MEPPTTPTTTVRLTISKIYVAVAVQLWIAILSAQSTSPLPASTEINLVYIPLDHYLDSLATAGQFLVGEPPRPLFLRADPVDRLAETRQ